MIISRTPLRISFVGGGSDISAYYKYKPGAVVTTAINKYIYNAVNKKMFSYSTDEFAKDIDTLERYTKVMELFKKWT